MVTPRSLGSAEMAGGFGELMSVLERTILKEAAKSVGPYGSFNVPLYPVVLDDDIGLIAAGKRAVREMLPPGSVRFAIKDQVRSSVRRWRVSIKNP